MFLQKISRNKRFFNPTPLANDLLLNRTLTFPHKPLYLNVRYGTACKCNSLSVATNFHKPKTSYIQIGELFHTGEVLDMSVLGDAKKKAEEAAKKAAEETKKAAEKGKEKTEKAVEKSH